MKASLDKRNNLSDQDTDAYNQTFIGQENLKSILDIYKRLLERNRFLEDQLIKLTNDYKKVVEKNNEELRSLKKAIQNLENKLERINEARSITVDIPEELVFED